MLALLSDELRCGRDVCGRVGSKGTVVDGVIEKDALGSDGGMGDGIGDRPDSEISVLEDSAPGEELPARHPKKELILLPGVFGCLLSPIVDEVPVRRGGSICSGAGPFDGRCRAIVVARFGFVAGDIRLWTKDSLTRRLCTRVAFVNRVE